MDDRLNITYPEITFDPQEMVLEAERRLARRRRRDQWVFLSVILMIGAVMLGSLIYYQVAFVWAQLALMLIISPGVLLLNFILRRSRRGHSHGY